MWRRLVDTLIAMILFALVDLRAFVVKALYVLVDFIAFAAITLFVLCTINPELLLAWRYPPDLVDTEFVDTEIQADPGLFPMGLASPGSGTNPIKVAYYVSVPELSRKKYFEELKRCTENFYNPAQTIANNELSEHQT